MVHEPKTRVDCSRHVESSAFSFDGAFDESATNAEAWVIQSVSPSVPSFTPQLKPAQAALARLCQALSLTTND